MHRPRGATLTYKSQAVPFPPNYTYLGIVFHEIKGLATAADALAASGTRVMHAVLSALRKTRLTQYDMQCRMFDIMVEPVLPYGLHVWGPEFFASSLFHRRKCCGARGDHVQLSFLRLIT